MRSLIVKLIAGITLPALCLGGALTWNTLQFQSRQSSPQSSSVKAPGSKSAVLNRLSQAIALPTISWQNPEAESSAPFDRMHQLFRRSYPLIYKQLKPRRLGNSLLIEWRGQNKSLKPVLLAAHLDVVPVEQGPSWEQGAFSGKRHQGFIWGRGTLDDKSSAIAILEALEALLKQGIKPKQSLFIAFGEDEEIGGRKGAQKIVTQLKQRGVQLAAVLDEGTAIVPGSLIGLSTPVALIGIAEKGYLTFELSAKEAGGHSSMPGSENAVFLLSRALNRLQSNPLPARLSGPAGQLFDWLGPEMGIVNKVVLANRWLSAPLLMQQFSKKASTNAMIRTTIAPTMLKASPKENVLATQATALINLRVLPGDTVESISAHFKQVIADQRVSLRVISDPKLSLASKVSASDSGFFKLLDRSIRQVFPEAKVAPSLVLAATDSRHYEGIADNVYRFLPIAMSELDFDRVHGKNERIGEDVYLKAIQFYQQLMLNIAQPAEK